MFAFHFTIKKSYDLNCDWRDGLGYYRMWELGIQSKLLHVIRNIISV